jgi:phosphopantetheinyl transferase
MGPVWAGLDINPERSGVQQMVKWLESVDLWGLKNSKKPEEPLALIADLRDPRIVPLLRPSPTSSDYADERRPGASDRGWFLARRAATRSLAAMFCGCNPEEIVIGYDAPGAPRVASGVCFVSVGGRGPFAAIVTGNHPVGIDFEMVTDEIDIIPDVLHDEEKASLALLTSEQARRRFLQIWTLKEAFLKALGSGLNVDPASVATAFSSDHATILHSQAPAGTKAFIRNAEISGFSFICACVELAAAD